MSKDTAQTEVAEVAEIIVSASVTALQNSNAQSLYSSMDSSTMQGKTTLFNAINNSDSLADNIGEVFNLKDVVALPVTVESLQEPGVMVDGTRIVLITDDGTCYGCMSTGVLGALERLFSIFGQPSEWAAPLPVKAVKKRGKKGLEFTTLELA